ncbi:LAMI_0H19856g1_1 [Lachancea mirantina]|uniref:Transcription factor IIIA n=1 Tax=Lachancea mirantina TaxID=1230905 RepID=A0A1G4KK32_9SACH|nr:LAMI_0H19856g1_1 [Lachancea mirantina]
MNYMKNLLEDIHYYRSLILRVSRFMDEELNIYTAKFITKNDSGGADCGDSEGRPEIASVLNREDSSSPRPKIYFCDYDGCVKSFTRPSLLTEHQLSVHQGIKSYKCDQCEKAFAKKSHLERHMYSHAIDKPFKCSVCGKGVTTRQQLKRHEVTHTLSFKCTYEGCGERFYKHQHLRAHILSVHLQKLKCPHCGKQFQRPYRLNNHLARHHNPESQLVYQCTYRSCVCAFKTWTALQQHIKEDHPKLLCSVCGKACVGEQGLEMHMLIHDDSQVIKKWKCEICDEIYFAKKAMLFSHYAETHPGVLPAQNLEEREQVVQNEESSLASTISNKDNNTSKTSHKSDIPSIKTELLLESYLEKGNSAIGLLLNSVGRKHKCPFPRCYRTFKSQERFEMHLDKHRIHEFKLQMLRDDSQKDHLPINESQLPHRATEGDSDESVTH